MMNKFILIACTIILFASPVSVIAQTSAPKNANPTKKPTITDSSTTEKLSEQINNLKDRIASRVAELNLVEKRGVVGTVTETSNSQITLRDVSGRARIIEVDEITKFASPTKKAEFGISDINPGMKISVVGLFNKQSKRVTARFVDVVTIPVYVNGMVADTDTENFTITVSSEDRKQTTVDIENVTKTNEYTADGELEKSGFSEISVGERIIVMGYPDKNDPKRVVATRVITFPTLTRNPKIIVPDKALLENEEAVTSSGSGKKLTPVR